MTQRRADGPHRVVRLALLTAIALTIFMAEAQLPPLVPIQGVKLGLANIVTVYAVFVLGPGDALMILSARVFLGAVFSGQMMTLLYSAGGGLLAWAVMAVLSRFLTVKQLWLASPVAAMFHNLGQLLVAAVRVTARVQAVSALSQLMQRNSAAATSGALGSRAVITAPCCSSRVRR